MDVQARPGATVRLVGTLALMAGLGVAFLGLLADHTAVKGFLFAALLVATGLGLRVEAAIVDHAGSRGTRGTPAPADKSADWYR